MFNTWKFLCLFLFSYGSLCYIIINISEPAHENRSSKNISLEVLSIHNSSYSPGISEMSWQARLTNVPYILIISLKQFFSNQIIVKK